jgi:hypothetical protein
MNCKSIVYIYSTTIVLLSILGCSKKNESSSSKISSVSFDYRDNKVTNGLSATINGGAISKVSGGNTAANDTTHGYCFAVSGSNGSYLSLSFEIPRLQSGLYTYKAFSQSWPLPLGLDNWEFADGTMLQPDSASISINITRYSAGSVDGNFSVNFLNGSFFVSISNGAFSNIPIK